MKQKKLAVLIILLMSVYSCKKEDLPSKTTDVPIKEITNYLEYDGTKYELEKCYFLKDNIFIGIQEDLYSVYLGSKGLQYSSFLQNIIGTGNGISFDITVAGGGPITGAYATDTLNNVSEPGDLIFIRVIINDDFKIPSNPIGMKTAEVTIAESVDNNYLIKGTFVSSNGKSAKLNYLGKVGIY
ncbi:MAG: hypothetical protein RBS19_01910 [Bacteroidales bacterium]|nr:hypothetical protein [Bacteroidales bacterium]MDY0215687.1 hypothetical protein [Bacteroidales bacterium]